MHDAWSRASAGSPRRLHLTFDDGPDPVWTPRILRRLETAGVRATFFVLGERVRRHPELVGRIRAGGHEVGLHGDAHLDHAATLADAVVLDTDRALRTLATLGEHPTAWRLPWGRTGAATAGIAAHHGLEIVGWDHDTHDWRGDGWDAQPSSVRAAAHTGGTVLLHDGFGPGQTRRDALNTLELVSALLLAAEGAGTRVAPAGRVAA